VNPATPRLRRPVVTVEKRSLRALEALDAILRDVDSGALTAPDAIEQLLMRRFSCATTAGSRPRCAPAAYRP
jgi:hypothetical protein